MSEIHDVVVLGAGLTGLSCAYHLDRDLPVFESNAKVGGLIRTIGVDDYRFDLAPHLLHFRSQDVKELVLETLELEVESHNRKATIYFGSQLIPYPFELNLVQVPENVRDECIAGLDQVNPEIRNEESELRSGSFGDYAMKAFGPGISNHYLLPYNEKIWSISPFEMTCEWMRFLPTADIELIKKNATESNNDSFGYNTVFYYPNQNGIQDLADAFARQLNGVHLNEQAVKIDTDAKEVHFDSGRQVRYNQLVSTIPLRNLALISQREDLIQEAAKLINTSVHVVNVVIRGKVPDGVHWTYFPGSDTVFYRASFPKNYFEGASPDGQHIISVEVGRRQPEANIEELTQQVVSDLQKLPIFEIDELVTTHVETISTAYCIYDKQRTETVERLLKEFEAMDIHSSGRYGLWEYSAMEDAIVHGMDLAKKLNGKVGV